MAKLTKEQTKRHNEACELLKNDVLTEQEREFVIDHWNEAANHVNGIAGAFFTPSALAADFAIDAGGGRIIDLCAGIGSLSYWIMQRAKWHERQPSITCIEINPQYVEVGRKVLPEATWICADVIDWSNLDLGRFDNAIGNPPFGKVKRSGSAPLYHGPDFEFHVIDIASRLADRGTFIVPQMSASFQYSGTQCYSRNKCGRGVEFEKMTGLTMDAGCGVDTAYHRDEWKFASPAVEIVCIDFTEARRPNSPICPTTQHVAAEQLSLI